MTVFDLLKHVVVFVVSHFYTLLIELADAWYQNQLDAVTVIGDVIRSKSSSYGDVERSVREAIFASETENWHNRKEIVKRELESRVEYLHVVYDMLTTMGLSESQADTVLNLLCSDKKISDDTRNQLVTLYIDCLTLQPFAKDGVMPIEGVNDVIKTSQKEKKLRFLLYVQSCLPITNKTEQLEDALAKAISEISKEKIQSSLMHASGVIPEKCSATTTELQAPESIKNGSKQAKQKRTTSKQKNSSECFL